MLPIWHHSQALKIKLFAKQGELMGAPFALSVNESLILWLAARCLAEILHNIAEPLWRAGQ